MQKPTTLDFVRTRLNTYRLKSTSDEKVVFKKEHTNTETIITNAKMCTPYALIFNIPIEDHFFETITFIQTISFGESKKEQIVRFTPNILTTHSARSIKKKSTMHEVKTTDIHTNIFPNDEYIDLRIAYASNNFVFSSSKDSHVTSKIVTCDVMTWSDSFKLATPKLYMEFEYTITMNVNRRTNSFEITELFIAPTRIEYSPNI